MAQDADLVRIPYLGRGTECFSSRHSNLHPQHMDNLYCLVLIN